ncbi:uncharacterized protein, partial [Diadema antillarum]|uniref:uncharacterized protein n=1 Tax=Diadema antillarum TaxID=105358 RepID=UPI003A8368DD
MASSSGMSSLLDRFRFEQKPKKRITSSSGDTDDSQTRAKHGGTTVRPATPESQGAFYRPPSSNLEYLEELELSLSRVPKNASVWILGDFNLPHVDWESAVFKPGGQYPAVSRKVIDIMNDNNLQQLVKDPTRAENILDLCFTNHPASAESVKVDHGISDHDMVIIEAVLKPKVNRPPKRKVYIYKKANFEEINRDMEDFNKSLTHDRISSSSMEELYTDFKTALQSSVQRHIPSKMTSSRFSYPWIDRSLKRDYRKKKRLYNKAKRSQSPTDQEAFKKLRRSIDRRTRKAYKNYLRDVIGASLRTENPKPFWKFIKAKRQEVSGIPPLKVRGNIIPGAMEKAEAFNEYFCSVFTDEDDNIPDLDVITCIPETPTSELPEFIESGSPVFPSSWAKKNIAKTSQRSLASEAISSLYSTGTTKSPTFGKYKQLSNGHMKSERRQDRNRHIRFTDSESDSEDGDTEETAGSSRRVTKSSDKTMSDDDSDPTHITNAETQDSLETVAYSYEDHSEEGSQRRAGGLKRKLSEMSSTNEGEDEEEEDADGGGKERQKERDDAMEQLRICFPQKSNKVLRQTLESMDWNINQAANALMADEGSSPPRRKVRTSPESTKQNGVVEPNKKHSSYQGAFDGWLQKPSTSTKNFQLSKKKGRETSSSSDDEEEDEVQEVTTEKKSGQAKRVYRRIRTFSSDGTEDISPEKKSKPWQRIRVISDDSVDHDHSGDERPASPDGCHGNEAGGTQKRSPMKRVQRIRTLSGDGDEKNDDHDEEEEKEEEEAKGRSGPHKDLTGGPAKFYGGGRKPVRKVWCGFLPKEKQEASKSAGKKQQTKKTSNSWQPKLAVNSWRPKPTPKAKRRNYSDSEDEAESGGSESDYEEEEVEVTEEFRAQVVSFINDATVEELCSIDGCSKVKANRICSMRPFTSFTDVLERLDDYKGLGTHIVWNCEAVFEERSVMEDLLSRCVGISERIQKMVTAVISSNRDDVGGQSPDVSVEGQITRQPYLLNDSMTLKPYQLVGLNWLKLMHAQAVNGILADEMGLGKTIQVIAFLAHLLEEGNKGPHLVVAPSSTVDNWARELNTWCPALEVILYYGSQEDRHEIRDELLYGESSCNVIVTSYNLCSSCSDDRSLFRKLPLQYAIFDEGHMLKNMKSQRYIHLMKFK